MRFCVRVHHCIHVISHNICGEHVLIFPVDAMFISCIPGIYYHFYRKMEVIELWDSKMFHTNVMSFELCDNSSEPGLYDNL